MFIKKIRIKSVVDFIKKNKAEIIIFSIFLAIRLISIKNFWWMEESLWRLQLLDINSIFDQKISWIPHLPFAVIIYKFFNIIFH
jgi:hypothetical protein